MPVGYPPNMLHTVGGHSDGSVGNPGGASVPMQGYGSGGGGPPTPGPGFQSSQNFGGQQGQQHPPPQQQQQQQQAAAAAKELNAAMLCRFGQETVQEIAGRSLELFQLLKQTQPPDGKVNVGMDRKTKFQETLKTIKANFKRLRVIYEKIEENFPSNKEIPFEAEIFSRSHDNNWVDEKRNTDTYKQAVEEYKEVMEHVMIRNRHLKDAIDHLRTIIWDVNTMLAMRKE